MPTWHVQLLPITFKGKIALQMKMEPHWKSLYVFLSPVKYFTQSLKPLNNLNCTLLWGKLEKIAGFSSYKFRLDQRIFQL